MSYDAWLEKPYQDAARYEAEFERFCEAMRYEADPNNEKTVREFEEWLEAGKEDAAIRRYNAQMDAREYENELRGEW